MDNELFSTEHVVTTMAILKSIIERMVDIKRLDSLELSTPTVASSLYGMNEEEFINAISESCLAKRGIGGNLMFAEGINPKTMGKYDPEEKTFVWTNIGIELAMMALSNTGIYPGDKFIRLFIGNNDPQKIIDNYIFKRKGSTARNTPQKI